MIINGTLIDDTFAEAFGMYATRLVITGANMSWARNAAASMTGFATSVIACGCEAGIEREMSPDETPDGRPGLSVLMFATSRKEMQKQIRDRIGQSVLTCPSTACFSGMDAEEQMRLGSALRHFGDGFQISKLIGGRRYWRIPVMDGEFLCEDMVGYVKAVGGGNLLILGDSPDNTLAAAEKAVAAMRKLPNIVLPFPGGVVRSGSKIGSKYKGLIASTNDAFSPVLRRQTKTQLTDDVNSVLEIVIDGVSEEDVRTATRVGMETLCEIGAPGGVVRLSAGNYGGKLGQYQFHLREVMA